jgi:hypothetical protein
MIMTRSKNSIFELLSVYDFRAYNIFSGWSCNGILICPICMKYTSCFCLKFGEKISYFEDVGRLICSGLRSAANCPSG